jgi:hypothetical protein
MRLYFREKQLTLLDSFSEAGKNEANFVLLFGKRKVGKTTLIAEHLRRRRGIYLTISSKASQMQLNDISDYLKTIRVSDSFIPSFRTWKEFFEYIFYISKDKAISLAIDEFQNLERIDPHIYQDIKELREKNAGSSQLTIIAVSSDMDFIQRTFANQNSPLYRFQNNSLKLSPFSFSEVARIIQMHDSILPLEEALKIYLVFGGLPKYYALIDRFNLWNKNVYEILRELVFREYAPLGYELKELIINEFSRGNKIYLSILQAIASGCETVTEIGKAVAIPPTSVAKYISELEKRKYLIKRRTPIGTADPSRSKYGKYFLCSYFDNFWFRFIQSDLNTYEMGEFDKMLFTVAQKLPAYLQNRSRLVVKELLHEFSGRKPVSTLLGTGSVEIGEAWNRDAVVDLAILDSENGILRLGNIIGPEQGAFFTQMQEFKQNIHLMNGTYQSLQMEPFVICWEHLDAKAQKQLADENIKFVYLKDLLSLADYHPKPSRLIRSKSQRMRKTEPALIRTEVSDQHLERDM